jgi:hypothetical protein
MCFLAILSIFNTAIIWTLKSCTKALGDTVCLICTSLFLSQLLIFGHESITSGSLKPAHVHLARTSCSCSFLLIYHWRAWCFKKVIIMETLSSLFSFGHRSIYPFPKRNLFPSWLFQAWKRYFACSPWPTSWLKMKV